MFMLSSPDVGQSNSYKIKRVGKCENELFWIWELIYRHMSVLGPPMQFDLECIICLGLSFFICNLGNCKIGNIEVKLHRGFSMSTPTTKGLFLNYGTLLAK